MTELTEPEKRENIITEREGSVTANIRFLKWLIFVLIVLSIGNFLQSESTQDSSDKATKASNTAEIASNKTNKTSIEGRDASLDTLKELRIIVANIKTSNDSQPELQNQAIIDALQSISRIEGFLCGGSCPKQE